MAYDQNNNDVPDVLESIDSRLAQILAKLPNQGKDSVQEVADRFRDLAAKLDRRSQDVQRPTGPSGTKSGKGKVPSRSTTTELPTQGFDVSRKSEGVPSVQEGFWNSVINKLAGREGQHQAAQVDLQGKRREFYEAKANMASAPEDLKRAQQEHTRALRELTAAQKQGSPTGDFEATLARAKSRLMDAQDRMNEAPKRFQQAQGEYEGAKTAADPTSRVGHKYKAASKVADFFGLSGLSKTLEDYGQQAQLGARAAAGDPTAAAALAMRQAQKRKEGVQDVLRGGDQFMSTGRAGGMLAGGGQMVEGVGKALNNPLVEVAGKFGKALGESIEKLRKWNDQLLDANMRFAEFSGAMASVQAEQMTRQIELNRQRGDRRSGVAGMHMRSRQNLEESMSVFEDVGDSLKGLLLTGLNKVVNAAAHPIAEVLKKIATDVGLLTKKQEEGDTNMQEWADGVRDEHMQEALSGRPARFNTGYGMRGN